MQGSFKICKGFSVEVRKIDKKYILWGLLFEGSIVIMDWEDFAIFLVILTDFSRKELEKNLIYKICSLEIQRVEKDKKHFLAIKTGMLEKSIYLNHTEVKFFQAISNRIIARCDILLRDNPNSTPGDNYWIGNTGGVL